MQEFENYPRTGIISIDSNLGEVDFSDKQLNIVKRAQETVAYISARFDLLNGPPFKGKVRIPPRFGFDNQEDQESFAEGIKNLSELLTAVSNDNAAGRHFLSYAGNHNLHVLEGLAAASRDGNLTNQPFKVPEGENRAIFEELNATIADYSQRPGIVQSLAALRKELSDADIAPEIKPKRVMGFHTAEAPEKPQDESRGQKRPAGYGFLPQQPQSHAQRAERGPIGFNVPNTTGRSS